MRKPPSFRRFLLAMVFLLEGLSLAVVISFLFAMLNRSMNQEMVSRTNVQHAELRLYLNDRLNYTRSRVEEIRSNNNIKIGLFIGMPSRILENIQSLYPHTSGSTFYVRDMDGHYFPQPGNDHSFLGDTPLLPPPHSDDVVRVAVNAYTFAYFAPIVQQDQLKGYAAGIYDLSADPNFLKLLREFKDLSLVYKSGKIWNDFLTRRPLSSLVPRITEVKNLSHDLLESEGTAAVQIGVKQFPSLFLVLHNLQYRQQMRSLVTKLIVLCVLLFLLTCTFSFLIIRRVTNALDALAKNALHIADTGGDSDLDTARVRHAEFLYLTRAFNKVLAKVRRQTGDLKNANETLQQQIDERRRIAQALQDSESQLRSLQNNIPIGLFRKSIDGHILFANPKMVSIFGYDSEEDLVHKDMRKLYLYSQQHDFVMDKFKTSDSVPSLELRFMRRDGTPIWGTVHLKKSIDPASGAVIIDGAILDITDRKKVEDENYKLEAQLRQAHKMEALGTLAGGIAHDFNNLLFAIIGFCELSLEDAEQGTIQENNIKETITCAKRAAELVRQILTFARQTEVEKHPLSLIPIIKENLKLMRATLPATIEIRTELKVDQAVLADPTQIHQIIVNLCTNAAHAMRDTGGRLTISLEKFENDPEKPGFETRLSRGEYARLRIMDTGHGMSAETVERIFDPYFTTKPQGEGTGMGLSVIQGIVSRLSGLICVESALDKGATFDIYLPALEVFDPEQHKPTEQIVSGHERILFIDDELYITRMVTQMLSNLGYHVRSHNNPVEAMEVFRRDPQQFDLVITDVTMPQMAGNDLAREMLKIRPDLPIILCTGYNEGINEEMAISIGVRDLLPKPLTRKDLSAAIRKSLDVKTTALN